MTQPELQPVELNREVKAICSEYEPWHCNLCPMLKTCFDNHGKDDYNQVMNESYKLIKGKQ